MPKPASYYADANGRKRKAADSAELVFNGTNRMLRSSGSREPVPTALAPGAAIANVPFGEVVSNPLPSTAVVSTDDFSLRVPAIVVSAGAESVSILGQVVPPIPPIAAPPVAVSTGPLAAASSVQVSTGQQARPPRVSTASSAGGALANAEAELRVREAREAQLRASPGTFRGSPTAFGRGGTPPFVDQRGWRGQSGHHDQGGHHGRSRQQSPPGYRSNGNGRFRSGSGFDAEIYGGGYPAQLERARSPGTTTQRPQSYEMSRSNGTDLRQFVSVYDTDRSVETSSRNSVGCVSTSAGSAANPLTVPDVSASAAAGPARDVTRVFPNRETIPDADGGLRADAQARYSRQEFLGTYAELKVFISECGSFLTAAQVKVVLGVASDFEALNAFSRRSVTVQSPSNIGKLAVEVGLFAFSDFDGTLHEVEVRTQAAVSTAAGHYNSEALRWRFWGLGRSISLVCRPTSPYEFDAASFRKWLQNQASLHCEEVRHPYLQGLENGDAYTSVLALSRLRWFHAPVGLFLSFAAVNMGRFGRLSMPPLLPGHFYSPPGAMLDREAACKQFLSDISSPSFTGEGMIESFFLSLAGVLLCPELYREFQVQKVEYLFYTVARSCSPQVALAQFFRAVTELVSLLYSDMREDATETRPGSGVTVAEVFRGRVSVPKWFVGQLVLALVITESGRQTTARLAAIEYFVGGMSVQPVAAVPMHMSPGSAQSSASPGPGSRPCVYAYLECFHASFGFRCKVLSCPFVHDFTLGPLVHLEAVKVIVLAAPPASALGAQKDVVLAALNGT
jgi:hypothetical protein